MLESGGIPYYHGDGKFHRICGRLFWMNTNGANLFCKKLGHRSAMLRKIAKAYDEDSINVGKCRGSDSDISQCSGQCNSYVVGDRCSGMGGGSCKAGDPHSVSITCRGGLLPKEATCEG